MRIDHPSHYHLLAAHRSSSLQKSAQEKKELAQDNKLPGKVLYDRRCQLDKKDTITLKV